MKIKTDLNVALIGCGRISDKHIVALKSLEEKGVTLRSAADIDLTKMQKPLLDGVDKYADFDHKDFLRNVDLAVILSESGLHYGHAKEMLQRGVDVLIEKPVTLRLDHALELQRLASDNGRKVYVVKQNRYNDPIRKAKHFCDAGFLGIPQISTLRVRWCRPQSYYDQAAWRGTWLMDGGVISNQASHHIDLMRWFMGPVRRVNAVSRKFLADIQTEDTLIALLEFESGAIGTVEATTATRPRNLEGSFSVQGSLGSFEVAGFAVNKLRYMESEHRDFETSVTTSETINVDTRDVYGEGHKSVYENILLDRRGLPNGCVSINEAIETLKLIHAMYRSVERDETVDLGVDEIESSLLGRSYAN